MAPSRFFAVFSPHSQQWLEQAEMLAPHVELCPPDGLLLEVPSRYEQETLDRISRMADREARIGGASTRTGAILAARCRPGTIVPCGQDARFLADLPVVSLSLRTDLDPQLLASLENWGIRTLGELARLPEDSLVARLGQKGALIRRLAQGEDVLPLPALRPAPEFVETQDLEWTIHLLEPLTFLIGGMLNNLCSRLQEQGLAVESLLLSLALADHSIFECPVKPAFPMQEARMILSLVRLELQANPPRSGVEKIRLQAFPGRPRIVQHSLLQPTAPHPEKLARTLTRLKAVAGEEQVGSPRILDTHRPDAVVLADLDPTPSRASRAGISPPSRTASGPRDQRLALRRLRPPQPIRLSNEEIVSSAGPWRSSGDWWSEESGPGPWNREEWDIERSDGIVCRVYWDPRAGGWFLEGIYD